MYESNLRCNCLTRVSSAFRMALMPDRARGLPVGLPLALVCCLCLAAHAWAQTPSLKVVDFGARGDAVQTCATTVSNSTTVFLSPTNSLSSADVGKLIQLFGVGKPTTGTNCQDLIAQIVSVRDGTNVTMSAPASRSGERVNCTFGTQNAQAFQSCIDACQGTNTDMLVPPGRYLLVPPQVLDPKFVMSSASDVAFALRISKGGIHFLGTDPQTSVLLGNGAWVLSGGSVERGSIIRLAGPVTNDTPLVFENLGFDGGVPVGNQQRYGDGPASPVDGTGWDITHDAVMDTFPLPLHSVKRFINCHFSNWRGEILKSGVDHADGFIQVTNCVFVDSDASAFNFNFTHQISGCLFSNLFMAMELWEGYLNGPCVFENSVITNVYNAIVIVGALTNHVQPSYTIRSNSIASSKFGILFSPARNLAIVGNQFFGCLLAVGSDDYAYQGSDYNQDILVESNTFTRVGDVINIASSGRDRVANLTVRSNTAWGCGRFGDGYGWCTNALFQGNRSLPLDGRQGLLRGDALWGQYFIDDGSNDFPPNTVYTDTGCFTNTVSYSCGVLQELNTATPNTAFRLEDTHPERIPKGATLRLGFVGKVCPARLIMSTRNPASVSLVMNPGDTFACIWTNSSWKLISPSLPPRPDGLHVEK